MNKPSLIISIIVTALLSSLATALLFNLILNQVPSTPSNAHSLLMQKVNELEENAKKDQEAIFALQQKLSKTRPESKKDSLSVHSISKHEPQESTPEETSEPANTSVTDIDQLFDERRQQRIARLQTEYKKQSLIEAGFSEEEASLILNTESEIALQSLNDQYERQRARYEESIESGTYQKSDRELLREQIGDENYERYLTANGRRTSANVNSVLENSPGFNAGIQSGDEITHYDGQRVFNLRDLSQQTVQGKEGETVLVEIIRNGEQVQVTIPRGPIGVVSGRRHGF